MAGQPLHTLMENGAQFTITTDSNTWVTNNNVCSKYLGWSCFTARYKDVKSNNAWNKDDPSNFQGRNKDVPYGLSINLGNVLYDEVYHRGHLKFKLRGDGDAPVPLGLWECTLQEDASPLCVLAGITETST
jgi:hypothetical protein